MKGVPDVTATQEFAEVFRAKHRQVRDLLLGLAGAFGDGDAGRTRVLVAEAAGVRPPAGSR